MDRLPQDVAFRREFDPRTQRRPATDEFGRGQDTDLVGRSKMREQAVTLATVSVLAVTVGLFLVSLALERPRRWEWIAGTSAGLLGATFLVLVMLWQLRRTRRALAYDRRRAQWRAAQPVGAVPDAELPSPYLRPGHGPGRRPDTDASGAPMDTGRPAWAQLVLLVAVAIVAAIGSWHGVLRDDPSLFWAGVMAWAVYVIPQVPLIVGGAVRARRYDRDREQWLRAQGTSAR